MKTTEDLTKEQIETFIEVIMANMKLELRKDSLVIVWQDGLKKYAGGLKLPKKTVTLSQAAKAERDEYWKEKVKEVTRLRMACACLKPNCEKDGWNSAMDSVVKVLLSPNKEENET